MHFNLIIRGNAYSQQPIECPLADVSKLPIYPCDIFDQKKLKVVTALFEKFCQEEETLKNFSTNSTLYATTLESYFTDWNFSCLLEIEVMRPLIKSILEKIENKIKEAELDPIQATESHDRDNYLPSIVKEYVKSLETKVDQYSQNQRLPEIYFLGRVLTRLQNEKGVETARKMFQEKGGSFAEFEASILATQATYLEWLKKDILSNYWAYTDEKYTRSLSHGQISQYRAFYNDFFLQRDKAIHKAIESGWSEDLKVREEKADAPFTHLASLKNYDVQIMKKRIMLNVKIGLLFLGVIALIGLLTTFSGRE